MADVKKSCNKSSYIVDFKKQSYGGRRSSMVAGEGSYVVADNGKKKSRSGRCKKVLLKSSYIVDVKKWLFSGRRSSMVADAGGCI